MRLGGESAALAGFEVHRVIAYPADVEIEIALAMMFENLLLAFPQYVQSDAEAAVGGFRTCDRLKEQVDRRASI